MPIGRTPRLRTQGENQIFILSVIRRNQNSVEVLRGIVFVGIRVLFVLPDSRPLLAVPTVDVCGVIEAALDTKCRDDDEEALIASHLDIAETPGDCPLISASQICVA
jgi:hypothetical protein